MSNFGCCYSALIIQLTVLMTFIIIK